MTPLDRDRLLKLCRLLASDQDGERANAATAANRLVERIGGWDRVLAPPELKPEPGPNPFNQPGEDFANNPYT